MEEENERQLAARTRDKRRAVDVPSSQIDVIWAKKWWIAGGAILIATLTTALSLLIPATYASSALVQVSLPPSTGVPRETILAANELAAQYAQLADSSAVIVRVAQALGVPVATLSGKVTASTVNQLNLIRVSGRGGSAALAHARAAAAARAFATVIQRENAVRSNRYSALVASKLATFDHQIAQAEQLINGSSAAAARTAGTAARATLATQRALLVTLFSEKQRLLGNAAENVTLSRPTIEIVDAASGASRTQPRPLLYGLAALAAAALVISQLFVLSAARRRQ